MVAIQQHQAVIDIQLALRNSGVIKAERERKEGGRGSEKGITEAVSHEAAVQSASPHA